MAELNVAKVRTRPIPAFGSKHTRRSQFASRLAREVSRALYRV